MEPTGRTEEGGQASSQPPQLLSFRPTHQPRTHLPTICLRKHDHFLQWVNVFALAHTDGPSVHTTRTLLYRSLGQNITLLIVENKHKMGS